MSVHFDILASDSDSREKNVMVSKSIPIPKSESEFGIAGSNAQNFQAKKIYFNVILVFNTF